MEDVNKVVKQITHHLRNRKCEMCTVPGKSTADCLDNMLECTLSVISEQQAEIERLTKERRRVIEQIENEINRLHKESRSVKDEVGTATYEWLINGFQASLDMIRGGE